MKRLSETVIALLLFCAAQVQAQTVSVAFVWDESGSISSSDFSLQTRGFAEALSGLPTNGHIEVTLLGFSSSLYELADKVMLTNDSIGSLQNLLTSRSQSGDGTVAAAAITRAASMLSSSAADAKIICLSMDGEPDDGSEVAANTAAANAKSEGVTIAPIGVGLETGGRDFLNRIASDPPVPTPAGFHAFAEVVDNDCAGEIRSVLNLSFTPSPADFGTLSSGADPLEETISIHNNSQETAVITDVAVSGEDAAYFAVSRAFGFSLTDLAGVQYRFGALRRDTIEVELDPSRNSGAIPSGNSYDALLTVTAGPDKPDAAASTFSVPLTARAGPADLSVKAWDAVGVIAELNDGRPSPGLNEEFLEGRTQSVRSGLVADGNAMLFLTARTDGTDGGTRKVQFEIVGQTGARLHRLDGNLLAEGSRSISVDAAEVAGGRGRATAILRAGASFPAGAEAAESELTVRVCIEGMCGLADKEVKLIERRAPLVLIHGLWSSRKTWERHNINMTKLLGQKHFDAHPIEYDGSKNPTPQELEGLLTAEIMDVCRELMSEKGRRLACTKADLLAHSMGGLVARNFIQNTQNYRNPSNFHQGSVRRYIPMATPQQGSQLGNVLVGNHEDARCQLSAGQLFRAKTMLAVTGRGVDTAVEDVAVGSDFLRRINDPQRSRANFVPTHVLYGDTGTKLSALVAVLVVLIEKDCTHEAIFGSGSRSDGIVPVTSAINEGRLINTSIGRLDHLDMTNSRTAGERYAELLNSSDIPGDFVSFAAGSRQQPLLASAPSSSPGERKGVSLWDKTKRAFQETAAKVLRLANAFAQQPKPSLSLSAESSTIIPGQDIVLRASLSNAETAPSVLLAEMGGDLAMEDNEPPYEWIVPTSEQAAGTFSFRAVSIINDEVIASSTVTVLVMPRASGLVQLSFSPGGLLYMSAGRTEQLRVFGRFHDGFARDITDPATGTTFGEMVIDGVNAAEGNSHVIEVDENGLVTALAPGEAEVTAHNGGFTASRRVLVEDNSLMPAPVQPPALSGSGSFSPILLLTLALLVLSSFLPGFLRRLKGRRLKSLK